MNGLAATARNTRAPIRLGLGIVLVSITACAGAPVHTQGHARGRGALVAERGPGRSSPPQEVADSDGQSGERAQAARPRAITKPASPAKPGSPRIPAKAAQRGQTKGPWKVDLSPAAKVGERFAMQVTASMQQTFIQRVDGDERKVDVQRSLTANAVGKVLEVNAIGQIVRSEYTITSCVGRTAKGERDVLAAGTVLTVRRTGPKPRLDASSGPLSAADTLLLKLVFTTSEPKSTDQEMFGTAVRVHVGEQWTIDTDKTAELLAKAGAIIDPADLSGSTTLEAATPCGGTTCLRVLTRFTATGVRMAAIPPQATIVDSGITGISLRTLPVDGSKSRATTDDRFKMHLIVGATKGDKDIEIEAHVSSREVGVWTPLP